MARKSRVYAIRVHKDKGAGLMRHEDRQRRELEEKGVEVIDITNLNEPDVLANRDNYFAWYQITAALVKADVEP
jgi:hypothetical protein